jgi:tetratricopeptide (TPR) repeat protein
MPSPAAVTISACLIVRDEAAMLDGCLQSLAGLNELIVVDTGSQDGTVAIAERYGARICHVAWTDDFAAARNVSLELATGDWILVIDADQRLRGGVEAVRASIRDYGHDQAVLFPVICNLTADGQPASSYRSGQLFRRSPQRRYVGRIHEHIADAGRSLTPVWVDGWWLDHLGFTPALRADRAKADRNFALLDRWVAESPDDADAWFYLGSEYQMVGRLAEAQDAYERGLTAVPGAVETSLLRLNLLAVLESRQAWPAVLERVVGWQADGHYFPDFWLIAGRAALQTGRLELARDWFQHAAGFGPDRPVAFESAGARTWKPAAYQALLAAEAGDWGLVRRLLAPWRGSAGNDPFLMRLYLHAGLVGPAVPDTVQDLVALLATPLPVPVLDAVDDVLQRFPAVQAALGSVLAELPGGRWLQARQAQRQGDWQVLQELATRPGYPPAGAMLLQGWALLGLGHYRQAVQRLAEACRLAPELAEAWAVRGDAAAAMGDEAAWDHWQQALAAGAPPRPVIEAMAQRALATSDVERVRQVLPQLRQLDPMHPLLWPLGDLLRGN